MDEVERNVSVLKIKVRENRKIVNSYRRNIEYLEKEYIDLVSKLAELE